MKNILLIGLMFLGLSSCDDFLEYKDKDKVIPKTLTHFDEFVYGEIINKSDGTLMDYLPYMTDEVESFATTDVWMTSEERRDQKYQYFVWAPETQIKRDGTETEDKAWSYFYHCILMCNIVMDEVGELEADVEGVKDRLLGEVSFMRALSYFYLVNLYGKPYETEEQSRTALGVPVNDNLGVEAKVYNRATLRENYDLIERDLLNAISYLEQGQQKGGIYRPHADVARLLLSRVYLYQKKYADVITVCDELLRTTEATILPYDVLEGFRVTTGSITFTMRFYNTANTGILFSWGDLYTDATGLGYEITQHSKGFFILSKELYDRYDDNDIRKTRYYDSYTLSNWDGNTYYFPTKNECITSTAGEAYDQALRIEEAYLNRAEAYIETGEYELGMKDVNTIRRERIAGNADLVASSVAEAREMYRLEKRLEFSFENMRWFDMRRWGVEIEHLFYHYDDPTAYDVYRLEAQSPNYVLPLPLEIQRVDDVIEKFERVDTKQ